MFRRILIANRGEIAVRVARTARRMGIETVAVYSDTDATAPHVKACDAAMRIGGPAPADSYLRIDRIIDAALQCGAEAVHPGYGFLSENERFADALDTAGVVFIGPTAATIRAMGSKSAAKDLMQKAGVPTTPGYQGADQSFATFQRECAAIGYPVLLKATAGGGGKGMKIVTREGDLAEALASAQREGKNSFGDDRVLVEKYIPRARHLEVQIVGDGRGEVVHFFERDCSVQRRHQKIIEEAPAPNLPRAIRERLLKIGVDAGKAVDYRGAGTVECLYDGADGVYFMEMNTRLQVEHPVSEEITGVDLVEWQLRIAAGEDLPLAQNEIRESGHAFEARLYAESPDNNFAPSIGTLTTLCLPSEPRTDSGVEEGQTITPYYDPMIAKIIRHGATREEALARLRAALAEVRVAGLETNARFLHALASEPDFIAGDVSTRFIDDHAEGLFSRPAMPDAARAAALMARHFDKRRGGGDPFDSLTGFRLNKPAKTATFIDDDGAPAAARLFRHADRIEAEIDPGAGAAMRRAGETGGAARRFAFSAAPVSNGYAIVMDGRTTRADVAPHLGRMRVFIGAENFDIAFPDPLAGSEAAHSAEGSLVAPMPGVVTLIKARAGETVEAGAVLLIMEAMKMEHAIKAPHDGVVKGFRFKPGDQVREGDLLVEFEESR